ncbi:hypothetical protein CHLNCDRAFT_140126 [Chlorella variabilis]|uniref:Polysaccharide pyruvyl transferase domain-containing protein n=1 Tax=Chlorella variabilis TaxID=554065 RepID=E1ZRL4_CHLVA|nr:hypothetical protein CHLNCDRAFT_140126 [Chlorella variabilis]EFN51488.1 hypothetical protein CHLNCDRAFT_140126 [Chlorella variabilis]|eukprot:XP_005843590.1 hypothetical protein CHLNCDRAFT_140126 [Chlorella variabilis]
MSTACHGARRLRRARGGGRGGPARGSHVLWKAASAYLRRYAEAKLIITTRLHCGVPAAGMGVPVILVKHKDGVTGRFDGFHHLFHTIDIWKQRDKAKAFLQAFDYGAPPPIPARTGPAPEWRALRCALLGHVTAHHPTLLDAIYAQSLTPAFERCEAFREYQLSGKGLLTQLTQLQEALNKGGASRLEHYVHNVVGTLNLAPAIFGQRETYLDAVQRRQDHEALTQLRTVITCTNAITGQLGVRAQYVSLHIVAATAKVLGPCEVSVYSLGTVPA